MYQIFLPNIKAWLVWRFISAPAPENLAPIELYTTEPASAWVYTPLSPSTDLFPNVAALMDLLYISRSSAVRPTLQTLAPIQSSTSFSQDFFGLQFFLVVFSLVFGVFLLVQKTIIGSVTDLASGSGAHISLMFNFHSVYLNYWFKFNFPYTIVIFWPFFMISNRLRLRA